MAKYGSDQVKIEIKDGVDGAGSYQDVSVDVLDLPAVDIEALVEEGHGFSEAWVRNLATGLKKVADITIKGFYDDTASTGTHALFNRAGVITDLKVTWSTGVTTEIPVLIKNYRRIATRGELTKFEAALVCAGTVTETP
jgi:hypothetical protein